MHFHLHPLLLCFYTLFLTTASCLPSPPAPSTSPSPPSLENLNGEPFCRRTEHVSRLACARAIVKVKQLPYFTHDITWSEAVPHQRLGHLPWYSYAEADDGERCFVTMDAAPGVHEEFSLQQAFAEFSRMYKSCIPGGVAAYDRIGARHDVQVKIGPLPYLEGVGASQGNGTSVDLDQVVPMTVMLKREVEELESL